LLCPAVHQLQAVSAAQAVQVVLAALVELDV
jgi:hypothetical protein